MKIKAHIALIVTVILILVPISGCSSRIDDQKKQDKIKVITTLFPLYDFAREIAGDKAEASLLLPPGVEPHSFEPTPKDLADIKKAGVFIYTGKYMEPWVEKVILATKDDSLLIIDSSLGIELIEEDDDNEHDSRETAGDDHHQGGMDPHIWLDPVLAQKMVDNIIEGFCRVDAANTEFYRKNGEAYKGKLQELHLKISADLQKTKAKKIMYGGHFTFGYFARRYGLEYISPYSGFAPDAEPTPKRIIELIKNMKGTGLKIIYYEELVDPKVARVIVEQTGAQMLLLHGAHNISSEEMKSGATYLKIMAENLERLKQGLGYNE